MPCLTAEQKQPVKALYKFGRKIAHLETNILFLRKSLEINFIPKSFRLKNSLPGNNQVNQDRIDKICKDAMKDEVNKHINKLNWARAEFESSEKKLKDVFDEVDADKEAKRVKKHIEKVKKERMNKQARKLPNSNDEDAQANDEEINPPSSNQAKRRRRFKRKFLQPQPKKTRRRKSNSEALQPENIPEGWNGVIKNISGIPLSKVEESLFLKGKKFCPVEKDPPIIRMQRELNAFFRHLRIQWQFHGKEDGRSEMEKKFYLKSNWKPPKAGVEVENFIQRMQEKFNKWKPPRFVKDNLKSEERKF